MNKSQTFEDALLGIGWWNLSLTITGWAPHWSTTAFCIALSFAICLYRNCKRSPHE